MPPKGKFVVMLSNGGDENKVLDEGIAAAWEPGEAGAARLLVVDQDAAHHGRAHRQEVAAVAPSGALLLGHAEPGLVGEGGGAEGVAGGFAPHVAARQAAQLVVERLEQALPGGDQPGNRLGRMGLADRDQRDLARVAAGDPGGVGDAGANFFECLFHGALL